MYCPSCGQQQVSGDLRFCNKCGLPMALVAEVLKYGGTLPQLEELTNKKKGFFRGLFTRKNGIFLSICWFILFVFIFTPFWGIADVEELAAISAVTGVFGSLLILIASLFFLPGKPSELPADALAQNYNAQSQNLGGIPGHRGALPPQQAQSAQEYVSPQAGMWKAPDTGDLVSPGSVTENTTRLLQKDEEN